MSALTDILNEVGDGSLPIAEALPQIKRVMTTDNPSRAGAVPTFEEYVDREFEDDNDYDNTFSEVTAAWIGGTLDDTQYAAIRDAVTPMQGQKTVGDEPKVEEPPAE